MHKKEAMVAIPSMDERERKKEEGAYWAEDSHNIFMWMNTFLFTVR